MKETMSNIYAQYKTAKDLWLRQHPHATALEIERAFIAIAKRLGL